MPAKAKELPPTETLREWFAYDKETGALTWRKSPARNAKAGSEINGGNNPAKYKQVRFEGRLYLAHRICFALGHDVAVSSNLFIDHIDGRPRNNRLDNLRLATHAENARNKKVIRANQLGVLGIRRHPSGNYSACITSSGKRTHLGTFSSLADAVAARAAATDDIHGDFSAFRSRPRGDVMRD